MMTETYIKVSDLRPGITLKEDVFANTNYPIVRKDTELSSEHFEVLYAFGVKTVKVEERVVVKKEDLHVIDTENPVDPNAVLASIPMGEADLQVRYQKAVQNYKKEFSSWQAGTRPDIAIVRSIVIPLIETFMEQKEVLKVLNNFSNTKDYIYHHSIAVSLLASAISEQMDFPKGQTLQIGLAGALVDCGMAKISLKLTEKAAFLTKEEFNEVKKHTIYSYQMIQDTPLLRKEMKLAIFQHHERIDGSGYPRGNKTEEISIFSQILAVADVFHAMTSERVHRSKESPYKVIEMIKEEEFGKFDIKVVQALYELVDNLSIGMKVELTNGEIGEIMFIHHDTRLRPMVKRIGDDMLIDLTVNRDLAIERVL